MIYDLVENTHDILRTKMERFNFSEPPINPVELTNNLIETMVHNKGMGLSANQCGLSYRCFVLYSEQPFAVFNPTVVDNTSETALLDEGCLSFPNLFVKVRRPKAIKVRYQDAFGEWKNEKYTGMTARAFLHELDHLNGVVYTKRANPIHLRRALNEQKQLNRQMKRLQGLKNDVRGVPTNS